MLRHRCSAVRGSVGQAGAFPRSHRDSPAAHGKFRSGILPAFSVEVLLNLCTYSEFIMQRVHHWDPRGNAGRPRVTSTPSRLDYIRRKPWLASCSRLTTCALKVCSTISRRYLSILPHCRRYSMLILCRTGSPRQGNHSSCGCECVRSQGPGKRQ